MAVPAAAASAAAALFHMGSWPCCCVNAALGIGVLLLPSRQLTTSRAGTRHAYVQQRLPVWLLLRRRAAAAAAVAGGAYSRLCGCVQQVGPEARASSCIRPCKLQDPELEAVRAAAAATAAAHLKIHLPDVRAARLLACVLPLVLWVSAAAELLLIDIRCFRPREKREYTEKEPPGLFDYLPVFPAGHCSGRRSRAAAKR